MRLPASEAGTTYDGPVASTAASGERRTSQSKVVGLPVHVAPPGSAQVSVWPAVIASWSSAVVAGSPSSRTLPPATGRQLPVFVGWGSGSLPVGTSSEVCAHEFSAAPPTRL